MVYLSISLQARVSNKRLQKFLNNEEIDENAVDRVPTGPGKSIRFTVYNSKHEIFRWIFSENR